MGSYDRPIGAIEEANYCDSPAKSSNRTKRVKKNYKIARLGFEILLIAAILHAYTPVAHNILMDIFKGDSVPYQIQVRDGKSDEIVDLTGYLVDFRVKKNPTDANYVIDKTCTISDPESGIATVTLTTSETDALSNYQYTAYVIYTDLSGDVHQTMLKSSLTVTQ